MKDEGSKEVIDIVGGADFTNYIVTGYQKF